MSSWWRNNFTTDRTSRQNAFQIGLHTQPHDIEAITTISNTKTATIATYNSIVDGTQSSSASSERDNRTAILLGTTLTIGSEKHNTPYAWGAAFGFNNSRILSSMAAVVGTDASILHSVPIQPGESWCCGGVLSCRLSRL